MDSRSFDNNYQSGSPISLDMSTPAVPVVPVVPAVVPINTTAENSSVTENVSVNTSAAVVVENNPAPGAVTGLTASGLSGFSFNIIYYIVGGLIGAVAIFFAGRFGYNQFSNWRAYQGYGSVASVPSSGKSPIVVSKELLEAEKKIKQATAELEKIKGKQGRLQEAERKFEESKRELEKIRRERY